MAQAQIEGPGHPWRNTLENDEQLLFSYFSCRHALFPKLAPGVEKNFKNDAKIVQTGAQNDPRGLQMVKK